MVRYVEAGTPLPPPRKGEPFKAPPIQFGDTHGQYIERLADAFGAWANLNFPVEKPAEPPQEG